MPLAPTLKLALPPDVTVWLCGGVVIVGATIGTFTVNVAGLLVTDPEEFVTTTV